jgi:DNA-binding CsgD family transcriptional regulator
MISAGARALLAEVALRKNLPSDSERLAHEALTVAVERRLVPVTPVLLELLAQSAAALESTEEAARILGAAARAHDQLGRVRWVAEQARFDRFERKLRETLGDEAVQNALEEGRAMPTDEAITWVRRARGSRKRPSGGWESLTPTELQIVRLAAEGLTNPEIGKRMFISRGTVKVHLSHIYGKLGVRNRSELAGLVARRQPILQ